MKPYKSVVSVRAIGGEHVYQATDEDARAFVARKLADPIDDGKAFVGKIQLRMSLTELRNHLNPPKSGKPKATTNAQSSSGDAGRGITYLGRYKTIHFGARVGV